MRLIKTFALAAIAVGAFTAFLGATSASAITSLEEVVLCKTLTDPCPEGGFFTAGTVLHGTATNPELLGTPNILCEKSTVLGETTDPLYAHGKITALGWSGCKTSSGTACTVTTTNLPHLVLGELQANHEKYENLVTSGGTGDPGATVKCGETSCTYGAANVLFEVLHVEGVTVLDVLQTLSGKGICFFTSGVWHAKYTSKCLEGKVEVNCYLAMHPKSVLKTP